MISFLENKFHLQGRNISYIMEVDEHGILLQRYFGRKLRTTRHLENDMPVPGWAPQAPEGISLDCMEQEYPAYGSSDLRIPAYQVQLTDGNRISDLRYESHEIPEGKPALKGLPAVYDNEKEAQTLKITLTDTYSGLQVKLSYTVFDKYDAIFRSVQFLNRGQEAIVLETAFSANLDLQRSDLDVIYFGGAWGRERHLKRQKLQQGIFEVSNARGGSGHQMNPFVMVCQENADETRGDVYGFSLVYSGNHATRMEVDQFSRTRIQMGIHPGTFSWNLQPGDTFQTPECILVYSCEGFGALSREYHDIYRNNLIRGTWKSKDRPILINNWEATYMNFDEAKLMSIVDKAKDLGIELFVLDDGWFGKRNTDTCSLGDWYVNKEKLPSGIDGIAAAVNEKGMMFGLWFEPEMISPDSDLYRAHPDWAIQVKGRKPAITRHQYVLDLSRPEICDYVIGFLTDILGTANISYVKWDMNRHVADVPNMEFYHRYTLGLYSIMETIVNRFPNVLFEGCSGGGGRFDAGILYYMPQIWTSDDSDAIERLYIQYGTSMGYPLSSMGAHVTAVPNHQTGRVTPLTTRGNVALSGNFGYELDITQLDDADCDIIKEQITLCKKLRGLMQKGDFYRLISPFDGNDCAWQVVSKDKTEGFVCFVRKLALPNTPSPLLRLQGLCSDLDYVNQFTEETYAGDTLMYYGIPVHLEEGDFQSVIWHFKARKSNTPQQADGTSSL